jgi:hypothetical protein
MRIAKAGGANVGQGDMHPDLAKRLASEATALARQFLTICVRALDYCPPLDILFGEFLRAIITADTDLVPNDPWDYRGELIKAFRFRGVIPEDVSSYSEGALRWCGPAETGQRVPPCEGLLFDFHHDETDEQLRARQTSNAKTLTAWAKANRRELGFAPDLPIAPHSFHPLHRIGPDGQLMISFVAELVQKRRERLFPDEPAPLFDYRGGATVVFNHKGVPQYVISKNINSKKRLMRIRDYLLTSGSEVALRFTEPDAPGSLFRQLHGGY